MTELTPRYPLRARDKAAWGGSTADASARVNPNDPLRAQPTLLLGSGSSSAHFSVSRIFHISTTRGEHAGACLCHTDTQTDRHTEQEPSVSDLCSHKSQGMDSKREGGEGSGVGLSSRLAPHPSFSSMSGGIQSFQHHEWASCSPATVHLIPPLSGERTGTAGRSCSAEL